jgi:DNA-binding transcriptional LysR family regulator
VDLITGGADMAVRIGALADSTLVAKRLAPQRRLLVAAPSYLADRRPVAVPSDLEDHDCLQFALQPKQAWYFLPHDAPTAEPLEIAVRGRLRTNDSEALLDAVLAGLGIALLPTWLTGEAIIIGRLSPLLPDWETLIAPGPQRSIWGVYPPKKVVSPKVRAFLSFIEARFGKPPYWDHPANAPETTAGAPFRPDT